MNACSGRPKYSVPVAQARRPAGALKHPADSGDSLHAPPDIVHLRSGWVPCRTSDRAYTIVPLPAARQGADVQGESVTASMAAEIGAVDPGTS